jgi:wobble nucleotide-excising tRNase
MISRFTIIKGIGRFDDCRIGGHSFEKNTIIFGQNTGGKSTFTDILWSFKTGDSSFIEGRKTFGHSGNQQVELFDETNKAFRFPSPEWQHGFENIEIFDTQFINENIFEGNEITYGHQKNLHSIIIGTEGKVMATEINSLQEELGELTNRKTAKTNEFNRVFKREINLEDFSNLPKLENIDELIKEIQLTIETANNQSKIKSVFDTIQTLLNNIINQNTKTILSDSIKVQADIVAEHILKTWKNPSHSKDFLQTGLALTRDEKEQCVFCGQELNESAKDLLSAYSSLFSKEYTRLQNEISTAVTEFEKFNPSTILETLQDKLGSVNISLEINQLLKNELKEIKTEIDFEFAKKVKDISYEVNFEKYNLFIEKFKSIQTLLDELKEKNVFSTDVNLENLNKRIKRLELSKIRHTKEWDDFLKEYDEINEVQETKKERREELREELNEYSNNIFSIHLDSINKILHELGADFKICDFQPIKRLTGQSERIFKLQFFNVHRVCIDETASNKPNFKNTLSESDKRVLAFAFFYSLMIHDAGLSNKIIVFDDPFSSFDSDRRMKTVQLLSNPYLITPDGELVEKTVNQLIILTHESEFFKWIFQKLVNPKALRIVADGLNNGVKKSTFKDCDVYKEFIEDKVKKDLKEIKTIYQSNTPITNFEELCVKCRKALESVFTRKYLFELESEIALKKSIRSFVDKLKDLSINEFTNEPTYRQFIDLCDNLNIELHENAFTNEGQNAHDVLGDFLRLIKQI